MRIIHKLLTFGEYIAKGKSKYYLHSPFLYQFSGILKDNGDGNADKYLPAERMMNAYLASQFRLQLQGAGARRITNANVKDIALNYSIPKKYGRLLLRIATYYCAMNIIELGTALGISTAYLAAANKQSKVVTFEAEKKLLEPARENHALQQLNNISYKEGNIDITLPLFLSFYPTFDLAFIDANHTYEATLRYFNWLLPHIHPKSIMVFDDIHWSKGMTKAWNEIIALPSVTLSVDLYRMGIVFFDPGLSKQNFRIWF